MLLGMRFLFAILATGALVLTLDHARRIRRIAQATEGAPEDLVARLRRLIWAESLYVISRGLFAAGFALAASGAELERGTPLLMAGVISSFAWAIVNIGARSDPRVAHVLLRTMPKEKY